MGYAQSYVISAGISVLAIPFLLLSRRQNSPADTTEITEADPDQPPSGSLQVDDPSKVCDELAPTGV